ncbi:MAG: DUF3131 domain-containing protein, partial [Pseudomonadota bacterium]
QMGLVLSTLSQIPLYIDAIPNRRYDTEGGRMVSLRSQTSNHGSGWSAVDIGRALIWLKIVAHWHPEFERRIQSIVDNWSLELVFEDGKLRDRWDTGQKTSTGASKGFGYEQYAGVGFYIWGKGSPEIYFQNDVQRVLVEGINLQHSSRQPNRLVSDPFFLALLEFGGLDDSFNRLANGIYAAHIQRWKEFEIVSAFAEETIDAAPWKLFNTIYDGEQNAAWQCRGIDRKLNERCVSISTKLSFMWWALYDDEFSTDLQGITGALTHPKFGFFNGLYDDGEVNSSLSVDTAAMVLEALYYLRNGRQPFIQIDTNSLFNAEQLVPPNLEAQLDQ